MSKKIPIPKDSVGKQLRLNIEILGELRGIDIEGQALVAHLGETAYNARRRDPDKFTVGQLKRLAHKYGVDITELFKPLAYVK